VRVKGDIRIKMAHDAYRLGNRYLWQIYVRGRFFYPWVPTDYVYAKTRSEALAEYERLVKAKEAALNA
jgi:hypothetical protein